MARGPSGPATMTVSAMPTNSPCSTTPVIFFNSKPKSPGLSIPPFPLRSRMRLPLSVTYGTSSPPRTTRLTPSAVSRSAVERHRKASTSTGSTPTPSCLTSFDSSTTTTNRFEAAATSFSRDSAPPRPLIRFSAGSTSSAPSTVRSAWPTSSVTIGIPSPAASSAVARDVGTPRTFSPPATRRPRPSVKYRAVVPLPSPTSMPSWTSSSALSAATCLYSSVKSFTDRLDSRGHPAFVSVHGVARNEHGGACRHHQRRRLHVDAPVHLDLDRRGERAHAADLLRAACDEFLAAKSRLDRHHVDQVDVGQDLAQILDRRRRVDRHTRLRAQLFDRLHGPVQRRRGLDLHLDHRCARLDERLEEQLGSFDHQVRLDRQGRGSPYRLHGQRSESEVRHEMAVHDIDLDAVRAGGFRFLHLLTQSTHVGGQDRRDDLDPH